MKLDNKTLDRKIKYWAKKLSVDNYKIDFTISEDSSSDDINIEAEIDISLAYLRASITFFEPAITENSLDDTIIHELLHIIFEPLSSMLQQSMGKKYDKLVEDTTESAIEKIVPVLVKVKK